MCGAVEVGRAAVAALAASAGPVTPTQERQLERRLRPRRQTLKRTLYGTTRSGSLLKQMIPIKTDQWDVTKRTLVGGERYESLEALAALNTL